MGTSPCAGSPIRLDVYATAGTDDVGELLGSAELRDNAATVGQVLTMWLAPGQLVFAADDLIAGPSHQVLGILWMRYTHAGTYHSADGKAEHVLTLTYEQGKDLAYGSVVWEVASQPVMF